MHKSSRPFVAASMLHSQSLLTRPGQQQYMTRSVAIFVCGSAPVCTFGVCTQLNQAHATAS